MPAIRIHHAIHAVPMRALHQVVVRPPSLEAITEATVHEIFKVISTPDVERDRAVAVLADMLHEYLSAQTRRERIELNVRRVLKLAERCASIQFQRVPKNFTIFINTKTGLGLSHVGSDRGVEFCVQEELEEEL